MFLSSLPRYTHFVLLGKRTLWVLALVLTVILVIIAWSNNADLGGRIVFGGNGASGGSEAASNEPAAMIRPRYQGLDSRNRPFNVLAERAVQHDSNTVLLENISADMTLENTSWLALTAQAGTYFMNEKQLDLRTNIHLFYEGGYEFRTERATVRVDEGEAFGNEPVEGQGPAGTLKADSFTITNRGAILRFIRNVQVTLYL